MSKESGKENSFSVPGNVLSSSSVSRLWHPVPFLSVGYYGCQFGVHKRKIREKMLSLNHASRILH